MDDETAIERPKPYNRKNHEDREDRGDPEMEKFRLYLTEVKTLVLAHESTGASNLH